MKEKKTAEKKDKRIIIRLSEKDLEVINNKAVVADISLSDYIRTSALSSKRGKLPTGKKICPFCKSLIPDESKFCVDCGQKLI